MPPTIEPGAPPTPSTAPARTTSATSAAGARAEATEGAEYARRLSRAIPPVPGLHLGHDLFEQARRIVGPRRTTLTTLYDPLYDDLLSEATWPSSKVAIRRRDPPLPDQRADVRSGHASVARRRLTLGRPPALTARAGGS